MAFKPNITPKGTSPLPDFAKLKATYVAQEDQKNNYLLFQTITDFLNSTQRLKDIFNNRISELEEIIDDLLIVSKFSGPILPYHPEPQFEDGLEETEGFIIPGTRGEKGDTGATSQIYKLGVTVDGSGSALSTGQKGYTTIPITGTITKSRLLADQSGDIVMDVWKDTFANYPPVVADTITASAKPTISSTDKDEDTTLTGWTTAVSAGEVLGFNVDSITTITRVTLELEITPS